MQTTSWLQKNHSTTTLGLIIQSLIADAFEQNKCALIASSDLSAAFDMVNIELLRKRLVIVGVSVWGL